MADTAAPLLFATDLKGDKVTNPQGENLGEIREIMIDISEGRVAYAVVSFGGFLGIGEKAVAVPWDALRLSTRENELLTDISKDRLKNAPRFNKDLWPGGADSSFLTDLYSYYGYVPYWTLSAGSPDLATGHNAAAEAARAGIGEAGHRDRDELVLGTSAFETGTSREADPAEASGVRHEAGGMSDNDMDVRTPGANIRSAESSPEEAIAEADAQDEYYPDRGLSTGSSASHRSFGGSGGTFGSGGGTSGLGNLGGKGPGGSDIGGTAGESGWMASRGAARGAGNAGEPEKVGPPAGDRSETGSLGEGSISSFEDSQASARGNLGNVRDTDEGETRRVDRGTNYGKDKGSFHTTSETTDAYADTSGSDEPGDFADAGAADFVDDSGRTTPDDVLSGQGDTGAFEIGEETPAVSGFGSSHDIVDMSGASGLSSADMTGGSEGLSAAEDLTIGSVDDLNTIGSSQGLSEEALPNEDAPESVWGGSLTGITSTDPRDEEPPRDDTGAAGSGRGHSTGDFRTTRRGSSSQEPEEDREERLREFEEDKDK